VGDLQRNQKKTIVEDWIQIKNEYINTGIGYRKLAEKYGVSFGTLRDRAKREQWVAQKTAQLDKISTETAQQIANAIIEQEVDRAKKQLDLSDKINGLLENWIKQIEEADVYTVDSIDKAAAALKKIQEIQRTAEGKDQNDFNIVINHSIPRSEGTDNDD
jgi:transposase-like protein